MGAFSPVPPLDAREIADLVEQIHRPVLTELASRRTPFLGLLYAGLMLTGDGPRVLEFNCRFGDPETQAVLPLLEGDLLAALAAAAAGDLRGLSVGTSANAAVTVVLAGGSYPDQPDAGSPITGVPEAEALGALVFHAGTARRGGELVTSGGRILNVTAVGEDLEHARALAYQAAAAIGFEGVRYRRDIALEEARVLG
jgi:phosphoribosylamine--glycine ligase